MQEKTDNKKDKSKEGCLTTYTKPLKNHGTFDETMKALVEESEPKYGKKVNG